MDGIGKGDESIGVENEFLQLPTSDEYHKVSFIKDIIPYINSGIIGMHL